MKFKDNLGAIAKIKEMWASGQKDQAEIARAIGYAKPRPQRTSR